MEQSNSGITPPVTQSSAAPVKHAGPGAHILAQHVWRFLLVTVLVVIGAALGYQLGAYLVNSALAITPDSNASFLVKGYHELVTSPGIKWANIIGFVLIGGLVAFLLGSAVFNKIVSIGETIKVMKPNEKVAIFIGLVTGLLLTAMLSQITLKLTPTVGIPLTVFIGTFLVYLSFVGMLSMKDEFRLAFPSSAPLTGAEELGDGS